jgi:ribosome-interacting GTPase 1
MVIFINRKSTDDPYILLINCADDNGEQLVKNAVELSVKKYMIRSKTVSPKGIELTIEVRLKNMTTDFVNNIAKIEGVENAVLVSYNGEYMS